MLSLIHGRLYLRSESRSNLERTKTDLKLLHQRIALVQRQVGSEAGPQRVALQAAELAGHGRHVDDALLDQRQEGEHHLLRALVVGAEGVADDVRVEGG